ncbi:glycosyltransferase family 4 protein [Desulfospira joergensenii]|uniref:glycosyltransferase family 4 protein n=1 Tax=Desulfospira joergensenii TaxID=53329 RepID=UPI0003B52FDC|nr:glycosyltransferase family 4 protein [Desulfospira joergensenii]
MNADKPALGMILKGYPRISETFISNEILLLESLGFKVHIISMRHPRESFSHASIKKIRARVDYLPSTIMENLIPLVYHNLILAVKEPKLYFKAAKKAVTRWLRTRKSATLKHLLQAGFLVNKVLPGKNIVHFQAHFAHSPTSVALFSSLLSGIPFSFFGHAKDIYTSDTRQLREKIAMAKFVVTCTRYNRKYLSKLAGEAQTPVFCVYHGINLDYFSPKNGSRPCSPPYKLLTVARMTEKKGLDTLYQALAILKEKGLKFRHYLIGDGDDQEKIKTWIKTLGLEDVTELCGTLAHEDVIQHYENSDLFVLGCKIAKNGDRDGIPNVMAESMAMGLPVVATDVSGIPEFLEDRVSGIMVPQKDAPALARGIRTALTDEKLRQQVSAEARKRISRDFDNRVLIRDLARIYAAQIPALGMDPDVKDQESTLQ